MDRAEVISRLKAAEPVLREKGVEALYLFGSYARDEAGPDSDVDVFVEASSPRFFTLTGYMAAYGIIRDAVDGRDVGYGTRDSLVPAYRPAIERSAIRVF